MGLGGEGGIRTHDTLARIPVFETGPFNHSGTSPISHDHPIPVWLRPPARSEALDRIIERKFYQRDVTAA